MASREGTRRVLSCQRHVHGSALKAGGLCVGRQDRRWGQMELEQSVCGHEEERSVYAPSDDIKEAGNIIYDPASHGTSGPVHVSYPG